MSIIISKLTQKDKENSDKILAQLADRLKNFKEEDIDDSDFTDEMLDEAVASGRVYSSWEEAVEAKKKRNKKTVTLRLNPDVLDFIKQKQGKGYQTLINEVLTQWAKHHGMKA